jgi:hypothetical protein
MQACFTVALFIGVAILMGEMLGYQFVRIAVPKFLILLALGALIGFGAVIARSGDYAAGLPLVVVGGIAFLVVLRA